MNSDFPVKLTCIAAMLVLFVSGSCHRPTRRQVSQHAMGAGTNHETDLRWEDLTKRIAHLEALAPGQGALMSQLGYHFGNLWFALDFENWALAAFYLHECRETLEQAVAAKPVRTLSTGEGLDIRGIAEAMDNTQFADLDKAIAAKDKPKSLSVYRDAMIVCHSCHQAAEMPFLQLHAPDRPSSSSIQFQPTRPD